MLDEDGDDSDVVFRDVVTLALAGFVACVILLLPHIQPVAKVSDNAEPPGNVIIEARWADGIPVDVDAWVLGPDGNAVGYSRKSGPLFNLLRDDLGQSGDVGPLNYETAYSRGILAGEYVVNVHWYRDSRAKGAAGPVEVFVVASVKRSPNESAQPLVKATVTLHREGEELTAFRFRLTADGRLVPGSVNKVYRAVRAA